MWFSTLSEYRERHAGPGGMCGKSADFGSLDQTQEDTMVKLTLTVVIFATLMAGVAITLRPEFEVGPGDSRMGL